MTTTTRLDAAQGAYVNNPELEALYKAQAKAAPKEAADIQSQVHSASSVVGLEAPKTVAQADQPRVQKEVGQVLSMFSGIVSAFSPQMGERLDKWVNGIKERAFASNPKTTAEATTSFAGELFLTYITDMLKGSQSKLAKADIEIARNRHEEEHSKNLEKLKESREAAEKAEKTGNLNKIFGWITTALTAIIAVALIATGAGAVAGAAMLVGAVISAAEMIPVGEDGGGLLSTGISKALQAVGVPEEKAKAIASGLVIAITVAVAVVGTVAGVGVAKLGLMAVKAATKIAGATGQMAKFGGVLARTAADLSAKVAAQSAARASSAFVTMGSTGQKVLHGVQGANLAGETVNTGLGVGTAVHSYQAASNQSDAKYIQANMEDLAAWQERLQELIENLFAVFQQILQKQIETQASHQNTLLSVSNLGKA